MLVARLPLGTLGSASHYLGLLAATTGRWDDAAAHFEAAIRAHEGMGAAPLLERSRDQRVRSRSWRTGGS